MKSIFMYNKFGTPDRIRTYGLRLRKPTLYPAELRVHMIRPVVLRTTGNIFVTRRCFQSSKNERTTVIVTQERGDDHLRGGVFAPKRR